MLFDLWFDPHLASSCALEVSEFLARADYVAVSQEQCLLESQVVNMSVADLHVNGSSVPGSVLVCQVAWFVTASLCA